jgi:hypothetical protein
MSAAIIEIGRELHAVKQRLEHGQFLKWIVEACELAPRHAQLMMRAAQWAEGRDEIVSHLEPTTLYLLAARSTPKIVRQEVLSRLEEGQRPAPQVVKDLIRTAKERMPDEPANGSKGGILVPPQTPRSEDLLAKLLEPPDVRSGETVLQAAEPLGAQPEVAEGKDAWLDGALKLISLLAEAVSLNALHSNSMRITEAAFELIPLLIETVLEQQEIPKQGEIDGLLKYCGYKAIADRLAQHPAHASPILTATADHKLGAAADVA